MFNNAFAGKPDLQTKVLILVWLLPTLFEAKASSEALDNLAVDVEEEPDNLPLGPALEPADPGQKKGLLTSSEPGRLWNIKR